MASIFDVAKYILTQMGPMSTWKLQKLCYYSQAWTLAWEGGCELFPEDFQAWTNGPVSPDLFNYHQGQYTISCDNLSVGNIKNLTPNEKENIDIIIRDYGDKDPYWLREQTHGEDPWRNARQGVPDGQPSKIVITKASMGEYYGSL